MPTKIDLGAIRAASNGLTGRFFSDPERGDIGYIAKVCDERRCDCERRVNADGDQDCSHSLYDWAGEDHLNETVALMLNAVPALVARVEELEAKNGRLREDLDHATAADGDWLSKASRRMCETVMGDREALRDRVRQLRALLREACRMFDDLAEYTGDANDPLIHVECNRIDAIRREGGIADE